MPTQRPRIPKTWRIATLASDFDKNRLQFPIYVVSSAPTLKHEENKWNTTNKVWIDYQPKQQENLHLLTL
jgi:hypothetical protein